MRRSRTSLRHQIAFRGAPLLLRAIDVLLNRWGYRATHRLLLRTSPRPGRGSERLEMASWVGRVINFSAGRAGMDDTCLRRSLAAWWTLRWMKIQSEIRIGVRFTADRPEIHAWVEHCGQPVNDVSWIATLYPLAHDGDLEKALRGE